MLPVTAHRVPAHTAPSTNESIRRRTAASIAFYAHHPEIIDDRLRELDLEWDVERMLETMSAALSLVGIAGFLAGRRRWLLLPLAVQSFFLQHAVQGWCPPLPVLRRLGFRTTDEIDQERYALKALRGDFIDVDSADAAHKADAAAKATMHSNGWHKNRLA
jgi:hypothetical protein